MLQPLLDPPPPQTGTAFSDAENAAMQRAVLRLFDRWGLRDENAALLLGGMSTKTLSRWRAGQLGRVGRDLSDRMSNLLGIHKALRIVFAEPDRGYAWLRKPSTDLGGHSALQIMLRGGLTDIIRIRRYLDSVRGGW